MRFKNNYFLTPSKKIGLHSTEFYDNNDNNWA